MEPIQRLNIVGSSGVGKSTLARQLAGRTGLPLVELDALHWQPDWTASTDADLFAGLEAALSGDSWILDGNYSRTLPIKWRRVQMVVWLDLPWWQTLWQVTTRTLRRSITGEVLWAGNRESLRKAFLTRDSIILWSLTNLARVRREYARLAADPGYAHIRFMRLRSRREMAAFVDSLPVAGGNAERPREVNLGS